MGVLESQTVRGEITNRRIGRRRVAERAARRDAMVQSRNSGAQDGPGWASEPSHWTQSPVQQPNERRRAARGALKESPPKPSRKAARLNYRIGELLFEAGRLFLVALVTPLQLVLFLLRPTELVRRLREAPDRARSGARRIRMASRDPETAPGRIWDWLRLSAHFVKEEVADMQDGFPKADEVFRESFAEFKRVSGRVTGRRHGKASDVRDLSSRVFDSVSFGLIVGVIVVGLFVAGYQGIEALKQSDRLAINHIEFLGVDRVERAELATALGVSLGDNLLELEPDLDEARLLPWVDDIELKRDLRGQRLQVRVVEHVPALILASHPLKLVDQRGAVFKKLGGSDPFDMPLLTVHGSELSLADATVQREATRLGLQALRALEAGQSIGVADISEIRYEGEAGLSLITRSGLPIHLGRRDFALRLGRLERAVQAGSLPMTAMASVDLGLRDRLVVVPRAARSAQRAVRKQVDAQPISAAHRARMVHLKRIGSSLEGAPPDGDLQ